jgi:hypothetical protein
MNTAWIFVSISSSGFMYSCATDTTGTTGTTEAATRTGAGAGAGAIVAGAAIEAPDRPDSNKFCE